MEGGFFSENQKAKAKPAAKEKTQTTSIDGGFSKETSTQLGCFISDVVAETGRRLPAPRRREMVVLDQARREHGNEVWQRALWDFARRSQGFDGLNAPWSLFIGQLDTAVAVATRELELEWRERVVREYEKQEAERLICMTWFRSRPETGQARSRWKTSAASSARPTAKS
jgi:hypothetical protein